MTNIARAGVAGKFSSKSIRAISAGVLLVVSFGFFVSCDDDGVQSTGSSLSPESSWRSAREVRAYGEMLCDESDLASGEISGVLYKTAVNRSEKDVPRVLVVGGIHGNEQLSVYVTLKLMQLAAEDETFGRDVEITFIPVMNEGGLDDNRRFTGNGVDLNRNFPFKWQQSASSGEEPLCESESAALAKEAENYYSLIITFHTGAFCISTLWDYAGTIASEGVPAVYSYETFLEQYCPAYALIESSASRYAQLVAKSGGENFTAIEGFDWYSVYGSICDWYYYNYGSLGYTIELDNRQGDLSISRDELAEVWDFHKEAILSLIDSCGGGITGEASGSVKAGTKIIASRKSRARSESKDPELFTPFTFARESGYYHIMVPAGEYSLTFIDPDDGSISGGDAIAK